MNLEATDLVTLLDLERLDLDLFRGRQPRTRLQRVFGGQVAAQALRAACETVDDDRLAHSLHSYFLRPGDVSVPIIYDVERVRDGRSFCTRRVTARQHGRAIYLQTSSFQRPDDGFEHADTMPNVPGPDDCITMAELMRRLRDEEAARHWEQEWASLDIRYVHDTRPGGGLDDSRHAAQSRLWFKVAQRLPEGPRDSILDTCALTYASDLTLLAVSLVPHGVMIGSPGMSVASLDHSMWFHRPVPADEWLLYDQFSPFAGGARGLSFGHVYDGAGALVSSVAQEGMIRRTRRP